MIMRRHGIGKVVVFVALAALMGAAFLFMMQEQKARAACEDVNAKLAELIEAGESLTPEEVHEKIGRTPHVSRIPGKHRFVEEYRWAGPLSSHTVYAYYETAATKLLEAVSMNQKMPEWEK